MTSEEIAWREFLEERLEARIAGAMAKAMPMSEAQEVSVRAGILTGLTMKTLLCLDLSERVGLSPHRLAQGSTILERIIVEQLERLGEPAEEIAKPSREGSRANE